MDTAEENRQAIRTAFGHWEQGDSRPFFELVADDVRWTVIGSTEISGTYEGKRAFIAEAAGKLTTRFSTPLIANVLDVRADGDKVFLQWEGSASATNGLAYEQTYCWVLTMADGAVTNAIAYLDTALVAAVMAD